MASGNDRRLNKISTSEILQILKDDSDHTKFFYLNVSNAGKERERQRRQQLPPGQRTLDDYIVRDEESDDSESEDDEQMETDDEDTTENTNQPTTPPVEDNPPAAVAVVQNNPSSSSLLDDKARRKAAMKKVRQDIILKVLRPHGWRKVYDKDMELTYRALYFNTIPKQPGEDDTTHILRVNKIRKELKEEVDKLKERENVNFKFNTLLSRPLLYDESALEEQSMREGSTQQSLDKYFN